MAFLKDVLGLDVAFNYKKEPALQAIPIYAPEGLDIYYDNVGGETLDAALLHAKNFMRVICCGAISQYNRVPDGGYQYRNLGVIVTKRVLVQVCKTPLINLLRRSKMLTILGIHRHRS